MAIPRRGILLFGELILDVYVRLLSNVEHGLASATPAEIDLKLGGNTWNISTTLDLLKVNNHFICTSSEDDISIGIQNSISDKLDLGVDFIPNIKTPAPRFVAVNENSIPVLRAIHVPEQQPISQAQKEFLSEIIRKKSKEGFEVSVLASSIESEMMNHIVQECLVNKMTIIGAVSSSPTVNHFLHNLSNFSTLILNSEEAKKLASILKISFKNDEQLAEELSKQIPSLIITRGPDSVIAYTAEKNKIETFPPELGHNFVNDLGAGDTFVSFLIYAYQQTRELISQMSINSAITGAQLICQTKDHVLSKFDLDGFNIRRKILEKTG